MKYKVGDKVRVRSDLEAGCDYGDRYFYSDMANFIGKTVTIKKVHVDGNFSIVEDFGNYYWVDEMFEGLVEEKKEKHKGCDFCNDDFYRAFTEKNGTIKFNKVKMLNIAVCLTATNVKFVAIVNSDERIKVGTKVKLKCRVIDEKEWYYRDARVISSLKILKKYYKDFYDAVHMTSLMDTLLRDQAEVVGIYKQETKIVEKEEIVETLEDI